jgi:hypothetical protein
MAKTEPRPIVLTVKIAPREGYEWRDGEIGTRIFGRGGSQTIDHTTLLDAFEAALIENDPLRDELFKVVDIEVG